MHHISSLFNSIELYSNHNSFDIGIDHSANNLWILNHLNFLDIQSYKIWALYLNEPGNQKSSNYLAIKETINEYLNVLKTACNNI